MRHPDEGEIHAWIDGALDPASAAGLEAHVAACPSCAAAVAEARGLIAGASRILMALDDVPAGVIPARAPSAGVAGDELAMRRRQQQSAGAGSRRVPWFARRPVRIAAGLMLVAGVGGLVVRNAGLESDAVLVQFETEMAPATARIAADTASADLSSIRADMPPVAAELPASRPGFSVASPPAGQANAPSRSAAETTAARGAAVASATLGGVAQDAAPPDRRLRREERASSDAEAIRRILPPPSAPAPVPAPPVPTVAAGAPASRLAAAGALTPPPVALADSAAASSALIRQSAAADRFGAVPTTGTITGKIVSADNAPLGTVSVIVTAAGVSTTTREDGTFTLPPLPPGRYTIEAQRIGYDRARLDGVQVASGDTARANLALTASALNLSEVVVTGAAARGPRVGSACFSLDVDAGNDAAGIPLLPRRVSFRTTPSPMGAELDAKARADRAAAPDAFAQRRALTRTQSEPAVPLAWQPIGVDSILVIFPTVTDDVILRLEVRERSLRGTSVRGTATSQGTPSRTATVIGTQVVCGGG